MINAYPCRLAYPIAGGDQAFASEDARLEISLFTGVSVDGGGATALELSIWSKSGRYRIIVPAEAALAAGGDISRMLAQLYPDNVQASKTETPKPH